VYLGHFLTDGDGICWANIKPQADTYTFLKISSRVTTSRDAAAIFVCPCNLHRCSLSELTTIEILTLSCWTSGWGEGLHASGV